MAGTDADPVRRLSSVREEGRIMKKIAWIVVFALVASVVSLALVGSSSAIEQEETLVFVNEPLNETGIDIDGDRELTPGDGWVSYSALLDGDEVVGKLVQSCQYIRVRRDGMGGVLQCVISAKLHGGQITAQTRIALVEGKTSGTSAAITGGTGRYENVRGSVTGEAIEGSMNTEITLHLIP